jgi:Uma2 family endonuclease
MRAASDTSPEFVWEIAALYPPQGAWSAGEYLALTDSTNRLIEFIDGRVEFLAMPTKEHQLLLMYLLEALRTFVISGDLGIALPAPLRVKIRDDQYREPDIVFMKSANKARARSDYFDGADLVMEVVSEDEKSRARDLVDKVIDYAEAHIAEYWIVDPRDERITVFALPDAATKYREHGVFGPGQRAASALLDGFSVAVTDVFAAAKQ